MTPWQAIVAAAESDERCLHSACVDPARQQEQLLHGLVRRNLDTVFGVEHRFDSIESLADFRRLVPIRTYDEHEHWIARIARGEEGILTRDEVIAFEETGGTSGGGKLIPYTAASLSAFRSAVLPWLASLVRRRPGVCNGRAYVAVSPVTRPSRRLPSGRHIGLPSEGAYLGAELAGVFGALMALPPTEPGLSVEQWRIETLAGLVRCHDLAFISIWSPTLLLELLEALPTQAEHVLAALHACADSHAVLRLERALSRGSADTRVLWPQLDTISMWTDGASSAYAQRVALQFPHVDVDSKGLLATESAVTVRIDASDGCIPALTSAVIELIDAEGRCHLAHEIEAGVRYRVVITTPGGLYRYDMGDEVECVAVADVPRLRFVGRTGLVSDLVGEKLTDGFVASAIQPFRRPACLVPQPAPNPHYEIWIDAHDAGDGDGLARRVDERLRSNPQYHYARELGQLRAPVTVFHPGFMQHRRAALVAQGRRLADIKVQALVLDRDTLPARLPRGHDA